ncbi:uncharacterized protein LOC116043045 isoform X3 [Sander lucioperca]|uniref:uncharacterized protein LOC116043045 isoform X2 n=1 Tax=Sander lucioperca TaxID=283035 RepID=UPI00165372F9|nr:uncharacterized protein LOC116043045 isoform X2 [Sander lucioperca]XP_035856275.1 uncharacterized protein LOC116043045 isoform X3 [Sander lucioperca]
MIGKVCREHRPGVTSHPDVTFMRAPECVLCFSSSAQTVCKTSNVSLEMESTNINDRHPSQHKLGQHLRKRVLSNEALLSKRENDRRRSKTRVNLGRAFRSWRELGLCLRIKSDSALAFFLLNSYLRKSENRPEQPTIEEGSSTESSYLRESENHPEQPTIEESSSTESSESVHEEYPLMMCSQNEVEQETCTAPSVQSSENGKLHGTWAVMDRSPGQVRSTGIQANVPETCTATMEKPTLQHIVDEEAILQLMKNCPMCDRNCRCTKRTRSPYFIVYQSCYYCNYQRKWANQPEARNLDFRNKKLKPTNKVSVNAKAVITA